MGLSLEPLADEDLCRLVGLPGIGLMVFLITQASPTADVPGGYAVRLSIAELKEKLGWGSSRLNAEMRGLTVAGLVHVEAGKRYGRGRPSTSNRYFLTHEPHLNYPQNNGPKPRQTHFGNSYNGKDHLAVVSSQDSLPNPETGTQEGVYVVDKSLQQHTKFLTNSLAAIGWVGPPPTKGDPVSIAAAAQYLSKSKSQKNPPGFLRYLCDSDSLEGFLMREGVLKSDPNGVQERSLDSSPQLMPYPEIVQRQIDEPDWYDAVVAEATRQARMAGIPLTMTLVRTVALRFVDPLEDNVDFTAEISGTD